MGQTGALMQAYRSLQTQVEQHMEKLNPRPNCILADTFLLWTGETAKKFQIPRIIFDGMNCLTRMCNHVLYFSMVYESVGESELFVLPGLPDHIELTRSQLPFAFNPRLKGMSDFNEKLLASESEAYGIVVNSFEELEQGYVDEYQKVKGDKVWCIGPLSLCHKDESEKVQSLALAPESSKRPFIWVVRAGHKIEKIEKWIDEQGFGERTKDRALLICGWAPQLLVLSHPAVRGFLTHCGWNSNLEEVCAGVPMVTWPQFQEQFYNEKLVVQVLRTRVSFVKSEAFLKAIEMVMEEGKEGKERRKRAKELSKIANRAMEEGGSSHRNMTRLIEDIKNQAKIGN
ncbi:putative trans-zeatin O-beta-D-glucosyltransferase [Helianthus annuus]|uniref:Putative UDP-glucosyl transferase 73C7 n=1 Tax=Helianthus annuus TaxID=4232 RepID=A0A251SRS4_HELAN|nr:putative trans-zeatin O-beta-D-glucosyltransferase [Helianthus annuus]KAJ0480972.1 putative trans-zeatin O-beta-D-glucosyltransferase [Helianthus annuus]KAJ0497501.1 putative trans-zeatin O-beta-D-glucosyltransferase [Helianthus annuus]KAJ0663518.1 putative trans-zeatin O-beta-D-glucosyltransferase [Helianthus annuus]KAJ0671013.1 putative trans-zeatin O-beta-D-glucosyltransferase [Helianthus annuus]